MASISLEDVIREVVKVLGDSEFQASVWRASLNAEEKTWRLLGENKWLVELAREVEEAKKRVAENIELYVEMTKESLEKINARVYLAGDSSEARETVGRIVGSRKTIVFSKSMVAEEIGLREYLEELGNEVWETDLGQLLVQLEKGKPMHTTAPAIHLSRKKAARLVRKKLGVKIDENASPEEIVRAVRGFLRKKFIEADVGISGANAIAADTGSIFLLENEGNIRLATSLPPKHIVVAGVEKIVPSMLDAYKTVLVQAAYAGLYPPTYISIISGPSSTADIEHHRVYGAHGPLELHVVLIDNGRISASKHWALKNQLRCVRCGRCQWECPVWRHTANIWGGPAYGGPMGVIWTAITMGEDAGAALSMLCLGCGRCDLVCPVRIPLSKIIRYLKTRYASSLARREES